MEPIVRLVLRGKPRDLDVARVAAATVQQARRAIFGDDRRPFRSMATAIAWLDRTIAEEESDDEAPPADASVGPLLARWKQEAPAGSEPRLTWTRLAVPFPDGTRTVVVRADSRLAPLAIASHTIADALGAWEQEVVRHILVGGPLRTPRAVLEIVTKSATLPGGENVARDLAVLRLAELPQDREWRRLLTRIRRAWSHKPDHAAVLERVMAEKGAPPERGSTRYWQDVLAAARAAGVTRWKTWRGVRQFWLGPTARKGKDTV